jgi:hypothetical protein
LVYNGSYPDKPSEIENIEGEQRGVLRKSSIDGLNQSTLYANKN